MTSTFADDEVLREFLVESYENLDALERDLVGLEETEEAMSDGVILEADDLIIL